jgi:hypothetical protein
MKWILFTGTWKLTNQAVEHDVRAAAREVFERGDGLLTGGATGVDYFAMDEFVKLNPACTRIRVFIPARLDHFIADYHKNWKWDPVTEEDINRLAGILNLIKERNPSALFEVKKEDGDISQAEYDLRHNEEVMFSDEVYAFQVNGSTGTQDTIDKSVAAGLPVTLHKKYTI